MNATQLLVHFDHLAEAPDAVPRLRRFILDLAVRGKLVEQDAVDEPASALLKQIESEIARLVTIGEMRKPKTLPPIEVEDEPFGAPTGWRWVRIRQVTSDRGQTTPVGEFTYIDVGSINKEAGVLGEHRVLWAGDAPSRARKVVGKGDVLYSCVRPTLLNIAVVDDEITPTPIASTAFAVLNSFGLVLPRYLWIALRSPYLEAIVESGMRGQAYPAINDAEFALLPLALPPLAEQHRIVAKVDELMALCDQLEAARQERERRRDRLAVASLQRLNQPSADTTHEAQREHARFHLHHLPRLTTRLEHIKAMRQTIFDLACDGRLSRLASDNHSIRLEWVGLSKDSPLAWGWKKVGDVADLLSGKAFKADEYSKTGLRLFQIANVSFGVTKWDALNYLPESYTERFPELILKAGDLLIALNRPLLNRQVKAAILGESDLPAILYQRVGKFVFFDKQIVDPKFFLCYLSSTVFINQLESNMQGSDQPFINKSQLMEFGIPLPPLAEQHHIVSKVDELMALCDQLEAQLNVIQTDSTRLLESVLSNALC